MDPRPMNRVEYVLVNHIKALQSSLRDAENLKSEVTVTLFKNPKIIKALQHAVSML